LINEVVREMEMLSRKRAEVFARNNREVVRPAIEKKPVYHTVFFLRTLSIVEIFMKL
jgi:hypothetical protein